MPHVAARTASRDRDTGRYQSHRPEQTLLYQIVHGSIQVEVARLHAPRRNAGRQTRYRAAPTIHANPFHVLAEAA